jgi:LacI family transcriptional regulator
MKGLYLSGGGTQGVLAALRDSGRAGQTAVIAYDLTEATRLALLDGTLDLVISHPFAAIGRRAVEMILSDTRGDAKQGRTMHYVGFELFTPESA